MKERPLAPSLAEETGALILDFPDPHLCAELSGDGGGHLKLLSRALDIKIRQRGTRLALQGEKAALAADCLQKLYERLSCGEALSAEDVAAALRFSENEREDAAPVIITSAKRIRARSATQARYMEALTTKSLSFALGSAGSGKTYLAAAAAVQALEEGEVSRIVLSRPALEAGERLGFLPGDMREKVDPYLKPLHEALSDLMTKEAAKRHMRLGAVEIAPLAFMRGRTFSETFFVLDEAQNCRAEQMKMALTRIGSGSRMAVAGDPAESDLPKGAQGALARAAKLMARHHDVAVLRFSEKDAQRHPLVRDILRAYQEEAKEAQNTKGEKSA